MKAILITIAICLSVALHGQVQAPYVVYSHDTIFIGSVPDSVIHYMCWNDDGFRNHISYEIVLLNAYLRHSASSGHATSLIGYITWLEKIMVEYVNRD